MRLHGANYYFVDQKHPVVDLLYHNQEALGTKIDPNDMVNGKWYRINCEVFDDSCHTLDVKVFNKTPQVFDLSKLRCTLQRPDNIRWMETPLMQEEINDSSSSEEKKLAYKRYMNTPIYVYARIAVDYSIPPAVEVAAADVAAYPGDPGQGIPYRALGGAVGQGGRAVPGAPQLPANNRGLTT